MGDMFSLKGKCVVVIGASSGIGEAVARGAARQDAAFVGCFDTKEAEAAAVAKSIAKDGTKAEGKRVDITDAAAVNSALDEVFNAHGRLDGVVCTPAINVRKPILDYTVADFEKVMNVNLTGTFNVLQAAGRIMTAQKSGSIVLFSSIRSIVVEPGQATYSMTKAGILQLAKGAATEWAQHGVRVNAVGPGVVETPLTAPIKNNKEWYDAYAKKNPMQRWASPDEMVGPTLFLVSDAASYVTGTIIYADGGWLAADGRFTPPGM